MASRETIRQYYRDYLGREPERGAYDYWADKSDKEVLHGVVNSPEHRSQRKEWADKLGVRERDVYVYHGDNPHWSESHSGDYVISDSPLSYKYYKEVGRTKDGRYIYFDGDPGGGQNPIHKFTEKIVPNEVWGALELMDVTGLTVPLLGGREAERAAQSKLKKYHLSDVNKYFDMVGDIAVTVALTALTAESGGWGGAAYQAVKTLGQGAESQLIFNQDVDWGKLALQTGVNVATAYFAGTGQPFLAAATAAGGGKLLGESNRDIVAQALTSYLGSRLGSHIGSNIAAKATTTEAQNQMFKAGLASGAVGFGTGLAITGDTDKAIAMAAQAGVTGAASARHAIPQEKFEGTIGKSSTSTKPIETEKAGSVTGESSQISPTIKEISEPRNEVQGEGGKPAPKVVEESKQGLPQGKSEPTLPVADVSSEQKNIPQPANVEAQTGSSDTGAASTVSEKPASAPLDKSDKSGKSSEHKSFIKRLFGGGGGGKSTKVTVAEQKLQQLQETIDKTVSTPRMQTHLKELDANGTHRVYVSTGADGELNLAYTPTAGSKEYVVVQSVDAKGNIVYGLQPAALITPTQADQQRKGVWGFITEHPVLSLGMLNLAVGVGTYIYGRKQQKKAGKEIEETDEEYSDAMDYLAQMYGTADFGGSEEPKAVKTSTVPTLLA